MRTRMSLPDQRLLTATDKSMQSLIRAISVIVYRDKMRLIQLADHWSASRPRHLIINA